jgi:hypothetical protein
MSILKRASYERQCGKKVSDVDYKLYQLNALPLSPIETQEERNNQIAELMKKKIEPELTCKQFICKWVSEFLTENIDKIDERHCDLSGSGTSKQKLLKDVKKDIEWAMWVLTEVMNWGMDKDYTKELCPAVYEPEDFEYRVIKLGDKYIKIIYNRDYTYTVSFAQEKTKTVTYWD